MSIKSLKVIAGLILDNNRYLIAKRDLNKSLGGLWEFPGGKVDNDETPEECLKRELLEELHIDASIGEFLCKNTHDYDNFSIDLHLYKVNSFKGKVVNTEHEEIRWIDKNGFNNLDFAPADIPLIKYIINNE